MNNYYFVIVFVSVVFAYLVSYVLVRAGYISKMYHKKIWNYFLLFTFVVMGLLGMVMAMLVDNKVILGWYRKILWIHVEFGIAMSAVAIFHIFWHIRYYLPKRVAK